MAICAIVVDLAHFNIQKVFTALANLVQLQGVEQAVLYCFFFYLWDVYLSTTDGNYLASKMGAIPLSGTILWCIKPHCCNSFS